MKTKTTKTTKTNTAISKQSQNEIKIAYDLIGIREGINSKKTDELWSEIRYLKRMSAKGIIAIAWRLEELWKRYDSENRTNKFVEDAMNEASYSRSYTSRLLKLGKNHLLHYLPDTVLGNFEITSLLFLSTDRVKERKDYRIILSNIKKAAVLQTLSHTAVRAFFYPEWGTKDYVRRMQWCVIKLERLQMEAPDEANEKFHTWYQNRDYGN